MNLKEEWKKLSLIWGLFLAIYLFPIDGKIFANAIASSLKLLRWYAREHIIFCLIPAFFIAGAISIFIRKNAIIRYLGKKANKFFAYLIASLAGSILAVCSCTILPLFAGIYKRGAGLGPAVTFLYAGPAINILAIILTARVLGIEIGVARAIGAISFSIIIGIIMELVFRDSVGESDDVDFQIIEDESGGISNFANVLFFISIIVILIFVNWGKGDGEVGFGLIIYQWKWFITAIFSAILGVLLVLYYNVSLWKILCTAVAIYISYYIFPYNKVILFSVGIIGISISLATTEGLTSDWLDASWEFGKLILPLLFIGILISGILLGFSGNKGIIPSEWIYRAVGGNGILANFLASISGAFMYFATLTEIPIVQGLLANGMGKGPALALLLAGPAVSLPNMLVIRSILGTKKTVVYIFLVIAMATISGTIYGNLF